MEIYFILAHNQINLLIQAQNVIQEQDFVTDGEGKLAHHEVTARE